MADASPLLYLWEQRTLFMGRLETPLDISTGASTLMFSLEKPLRFMTHRMSSPIECKSLLLPAGIPVIIDTQNSLIANCTLDPFGIDYKFLSKIMRAREHHAYFKAKEESYYIDSLKELYESPFKPHEALAQLMRLLKINKRSKEVNSHEIDPRIVSIINNIQTTINENLSLSKLASKENLSQSRLIELFKKETGLPLRRYRLWYRLYKATECIGNGLSMTDAAVTAGFNDSSHFNRTFRSMLGIKPTSIFTQTQKLHVIIPDAQGSRTNTLTPDTNTVLIN